MDARERFRSAKNYALYYGTDETEALREYDAVIVEPSGQSDNNVAAMQAANTVVLAYVSVVEIAEYDPQFSYLNSSDFLKNDQGQPLKNENYGTYMLDLCSKAWQGLLHHRIGRLLKLRKFDGLFLDTIGNVEMLDIPSAERARQYTKAITLVREIRAIHPEGVLIQNNGLNALCVETSPYIDGICWENPNFSSPSALGWSDQVVENLKGLSNKEGIRILLLIETDRSDQDMNLVKVRNQAREHGFLLYEAPVLYVSGVNKLMR